MKFILSKKVYVLFGLVVSVLITGAFVIFPEFFPVTPTAAPSPDASPSATPNALRGGVLATVVSVVDGDTMVNEVLVREGFARVATFPPDVKYVERFLAAEQAAREENKGLWSGACPLPTPSRLPKEATPSGTISPM